MGSDNSLEKKEKPILASAFIGLILCVLIIYLIEASGHYFYPLPEKLHPNILGDIDILKKYISSVPTEAMFFPLLSYFFGISIGGFIANQMSRRVYTSVIIGSIVLVMNLITIIYIPHPFWFIIVSNLIPLPSALFGGYLSKYYDLNKTK